MSIYRTCAWDLMQYNDHINLEIPVDIKKKKYVSNKVQDVHVVSVSPNVNGDSSWKAQLFDIIVCVTWSWHPLQTILIAMLPSHSNFSHFIHCKIKTHHTHLSKGCGEICTHVYTFIIFQFIGWKKYRV